MEKQIKSRDKFEKKFEKWKNTKPNKRKYKKKRKLYDYLFRTQGTPEQANYISSIADDIIAYEIADQNNVFFFLFRFYLQSDDEKNREKAFEILDEMKSKKFYKPLLWLTQNVSQKEFTVTHRDVIKEILLYLFDIGYVDPEENEKEHLDIISRNLPNQLEYWKEFYNTLKQNIKMKELNELKQSKIFKYYKDLCDLYDTSGSFDEEKALQAENPLSYIKSRIVMLIPPSSFSDYSNFEVIMEYLEAKKETELLTDIFDAFSTFLKDEITILGYFKINDLEKAYTVSKQLSTYSNSFGQVHNIIKMRRIVQPYARSDAADNLQDNLHVLINNFLKNGSIKEDNSLPYRNFINQNLGLGNYQSYMDTSSIHDLFWTISIFDVYTSNSYFTDPTQFSNNLQVITELSVLALKLIKKNETEHTELFKTQFLSALAHINYKATNHIYYNEWYDFSRKNITKAYEEGVSSIENT